MNKTAYTMLEAKICNKHIQHQLANLRSRILLNVGALMIGIGFGGILCCNHYKEPPKPY